MIDRLGDSPALRRLLALALLALALWIALPPLLSPVRSWLDARTALEAERAVAERLERLATRRAAVAALAARPDAPFLMAESTAGAVAALAARLSAAAAPDAMRLRIEPPAAAADERPGAPVSLGFAFEATEGAFQAFFADIQGAGPILRVDELAVSSVQGVDGSILLTGSGAVSTVPLLRAAP